MKGNTNENSGKSHTTEAAALAADRNLENMRYFSVSYNPDLCEGRGFQKVMLVEIPKMIGYIDPEDWMQFWANDYFGPKIVSFYGRGAINWHINPISLEVFRDAKTANNGVGQACYMIEKMALTEEYLRSLVSLVR